MNAAKVADYIGSREDQVIRFEEWSHVYYIQVQGFRPRFVSKKAVQEWATYHGCYGQYQRKFFDKNQDKCPLSESPMAKTRKTELQKIWDKVSIPAFSPASAFLPPSLIK